MNTTFAAVSGKAVRRCQPVHRQPSYILRPLHRRNYASTDSASTTPNSRYATPINAPLSTLPAPLDVPPAREPGQSVFSYYFKLGKGYLSFYKTGLKNAAWVNPRLASPVMAKWKEDRGYAGIVQNKWITRSDLQLLKRNQHDFRRIPLFAILFTICGEFTPLVVATFSNIVPNTCRIPTQIMHDRKKRERRITESFENFLPPSSVNRAAEGLEQLTWREKLHCSTVVGRHSALWPSRFLPLPFEFTLNKRLMRYEVYLATDDLLISKGGGVLKLSPAEVEIACLDRGIRVLNRTEQELRAGLQRWLADTKKGVTLWERLLARPSFY
ncbi:hypothetical protein TWF694_007067 [Orbilia ellipsospora]|uniref:Letm1 RBD domain-containing protein n=1 Tax=Orbilia ellipsospora TaxID=2528407 RepID=A0AAV9XMG2_9PEZI